MNNNPIYVIDDDREEKDILAEVLKELGANNEIMLFTSGEDLLHELKINPVIPFLIISDIHLPGMTGFELRKKILEQVSITDKTIPFIFWTTSASPMQIKKAYDLSAHGFFLKGKSHQEVKSSIEKIIEYWSASLAPE